MHPNEQVLNKFYSSFLKRDYLSMQECYHPDAEFTDSAFIGLNANQVKAMWHMLNESGKDLTLTYSGISVNENTGNAHWEAWYTFSKTGNKVHNVIDANFKFKDSLIISHKDSFDFYRWAGFAFGLTGKLIGWTPFFKSKVQKAAKVNLERFIAKHPEYK